MYLVVGISEIGVRSDTPFSHMLGHRNEVEGIQGTGSQIITSRLHKLHLGVRNVTMKLCICYRR
jgi:hypothetical protein